MPNDKCGSSKCRAIRYIPELCRQAKLNEDRSEESIKNNLSDGQLQQKIVAIRIQMRTLYLRLFSVSFPFRLSHTHYMVEERSNMLPKSFDISVCAGFGTFLPNIVCVRVV